MIIELQKEFPDVKIIAMSGGGLNKPDGYLKGAKKLGAACTLTKPIDREKMLRAVKNIIKGTTSELEETQPEPE
jgi:DNA-binding NarL/FixJ family response regulator